MPQAKGARKVWLGTIGVFLGAVMLIVSGRSPVSAAEEVPCCLQLVCTEYGDGCYGTPCVCGLTCCPAGSPTMCRA